MTNKNRINQLKETLEATGCDALLVENKTDLFYLTGLDLSAARMIVSKGNGCLIVDRRYFELCKKSSPVTVLPLESNPWSVFFEHSTIKKLGFDSEATSYQNFIDLTNALNSTIQLIPLKSPVRHQRMIKDKNEIQLLRDAAFLGAKGFDYVCSLLTEGVTEIQIADELEIFWKRSGSKGLAFDPIIAFGASSSMPHYRAENTKLEKGHIVLIDIGVNYHHYHSDMTRTVFFGQSDPKMVEIYQVVKGAQDAAFKLCRPGTPIGALDEAARSFIHEKGYGQHFTHSLGHGVGLEIHELPVLRNKTPYAEVRLEPGMVITIEPGVYLEGFGGVRLEDTVVIQDSGYENLTNRPCNPYTLG